MHAGKGGVDRQKPLSRRSISYILLLLTDADGIEKQRVLLERDNHDDAPGAVVLLDNDMVAIAGWEGHLENAQNLLVLFPLSLLTAIREMAVESPFFRVLPNPFETDLSIQYDHPNASAEALRLEIYILTHFKSCLKILSSIPYNSGCRFSSKRGVLKKYSLTTLKNSASLVLP